MNLTPALWTSRYGNSDDSETPGVHRLNFVDFKDRKELMFAEFEKRVALAAVYLFEIEHSL